MYTIVLFDHSTPATITKTLNADQFRLICEKVQIFSDVTEIFGGSQIELTAPLISNIDAISIVLDHLMCQKVYTRFSHWHPMMEFVIAAAFLGVAEADMPCINFGGMLPLNPPADEAAALLDAVNRLLLADSSEPSVIQRITKLFDMRHLVAYPLILAEILAHELRREKIILDCGSSIVEVDLMMDTSTEIIKANKAVYSPDMRYRVVQTAFRIEISDTETSTVVYQFNGKLGDVIWSSDCSTLAFTDSDLYVVDIALKSHIEIPYPVRCSSEIKLTISNNGQYVIAYDEAAYVCFVPSGVWHKFNNGPLIVFNPLRFVISPDNTKILAMSATGIAGVWQIYRVGEIANVFTQPDFITSRSVSSPHVCFSPDSRSIAWLDLKARVLYICDTSTLQISCKYAICNPSGAKPVLTYAPDGKKIYFMAGYKHDIKVLDLVAKNLSRVAQLNTPVQRVLSMHYTKAPNTGLICELQELLK